MQNILATTLFYIGFGMTLYQGYNGKGIDICMAVVLVALAIVCVAAALNDQHS